MKRKLILLSLAMQLSVSSSLSFGACGASESSYDPNCRYPQGDDWCAENDRQKPYAYSDKCLSGNRQRGSSSPNRKVKTEVDNIVWAVKGLCGINAKTNFQIQSYSCAFTKGGWVTCRTGQVTEVDYMPTFTRISQTTATLELVEYRGATGAPDLLVDLERCPD